MTGRKSATGPGAEIGMTAMVAATQARTETTPPSHSRRLRAAN